MLRMEWLNLLLASLLAIAPLQMAFAQIGASGHPAMAHTEVHAAHQVEHKHSSVVAPAQQPDQPCGQHQGPCLACGLCGAHCAASLVSYEFSPVIIHSTVIVTPPLFAALPSPPPPGEPPRTLRS